MANSPERMFATNMRALRMDARLSQSALGVILDRRYGLTLDKAAITRIEKHANGPDGARGIRLGEAVAIANVLDLNLCDLLGPFAECNGEHRLTDRTDPARRVVAKQLRALADTLDDEGVV